MAGGHLPITRLQKLLPYPPTDPSGRFDQGHAGPQACRRQASGLPWRGVTGRRPAKRRRAAGHLCLVGLFPAPCPSREQDSQRKSSGPGLQREGTGWGDHWQHPSCPGDQGF